MAELRSGIYRIVNLCTHEEYIGSSVNVQKRISEHLSRLRNQKHPNKFLQNSWNKYGPSNFFCEITRRCDVKDLVVEEQACINARNPAFNLRKTAESNRGLKFSSEHRRKLSDSKKGNLNPMKNKETRAKVSASLRGNQPWNKGKKNIYSQKTLENMKKSATGRKHSRETIQKIIKKTKGLKRTFETKEKIKQSKLGKNNPLSRPVIQLSVDGNIIKVYECIAAVRKDNFNSTCVWNCCNNKQKSHKGFQWKYYEHSKL